MPQFLVAIQFPDNYDPSLEDEAIKEDKGTGKKPLHAHGVIGLNHPALFKINL